MSYTVCSGSATCTVDGILNERNAALMVCDAIVNNPDTPLPDDLSELDSDEFVEEIEPYLCVNETGNRLTICYSTEDGSSNCNQEVFEFLEHFFAQIQSSLFLKGSWTVSDSSAGDSGGDYYLDRFGELIDVGALISDALQARYAAEAASG